MKVKVKVYNDPNEPKCRYFESCFGACEWCKTHDYSEACVPMLQRRTMVQKIAINAMQGVLDAIEKEIAERGSGCFRCEDSAEMIVSVTSKLKDGIKTGWVGGNLPAKYCPFCGRKLED